LLKVVGASRIPVWLEGDFGIDDEPAMVEAIRKDPRVTLSDEQILVLMSEALEEGWDAQTTLERLTEFQVTL
jgi:hypothetical protein